MRRTGHIYFIRCGEYVKVGFSTDHQSRIRAISANTPYEVVLEALHEGTRADEATFHRLLTPHHHKFEWFRWCDEVREAALHGLAKHQKAVIHGRTALDEARDKVGGDRGLARALTGISSQAVSQWRRVPPLRVLEVERATGVSRNRLRPDMYPLEEQAEAGSGS